MLRSNPSLEKTDSHGLAEQILHQSCKSDDENDENDPAYDNAEKYSGMEIHPGSRWFYLIKLLRDLYRKTKRVGRVSSVERIFTGHERLRRN
jgi:hypothetical protein